MEFLPSSVIFWDYASDIYIYAYVYVYNLNREK